MKFVFYYKNFLLELLFASLIAALFSLFAWNFTTWLLVAFVLLLVWHHINEGKLLHLLDPEFDHTSMKKSFWEHISQSIAYRQNKNRRDKLKTLRTLSKLNKNVQYYADAIIICEPQGEITWCNNAAQEMFNFYWHKKTEKNIFKVIFYDEFKHYWQKQKRNRPLVLLNNKERYIELNIHHSGQDDIVISARDITQFIQVLHSRQIFLANLNHELRTPLTVLQGYLEMLAEQPQSDPLWQKAIDEMQAQSTRMQKLLAELSFLAKIETATDENFEIFNLSELVDTQQKNIPFLNTQQHQVHFEVEANIYVKGDAEKLQSAIANLINNALKHAGTECEITIRLHTHKQQAIFSVTDNGIGIEEQHLPHLTERFYRVDESRSQATGGSGLGLAIVKHVLLQHHSHLHIQSTPQQGSMFSFELTRVEP